MTSNNFNLQMGSNSCNIDNAVDLFWPRKHQLFVHKFHPRLEGTYANSGSSDLLHKMIVLCFC